MPYVFDDHRTTQQVHHHHHHHKNHRHHVIILLAVVSQTTSGHITKRKVLPQLLYHTFLKLISNQEKILTRMDLPSLQHRTFFGT